MIRVTASIAIGENEISETFVRASGPGGQNVNKVATAVQLRFDAARSPSLTEEVRGRLIALAGSRLTTDGVLIIEARRFRTQEANRRDALARLVALITKAAHRPKARRPTIPTASSKERRLEGKKALGRKKALRREQHEF